MKEKSKVHLQFIKDFAISDPVIHIGKSDQIIYEISTNRVEQNGSLYKKDDRFFILYVQETGKESPALYYKHKYVLEFKEEGVYHIFCLNYSNLKQKVIVGGGTPNHNSDEMIGIHSNVDSDKQGSGENLFLTDNSSLRTANYESMCERFSFNGISDFLKKISKCEVAGKGKDVFIEEPGETFRSKNDTLSNINLQGKNLFNVHLINKSAPDTLFFLIKNIDNQITIKPKCEEAINFKSFSDLIEEIPLLEQNYTPNYSIEFMNKYNTIITSRF